MEEAGERVSRRSVPRPVKTALVAAGLILFAPAAFSLAETAPDNAATAPGADNTAPKDAKPAPRATDDVAAVREVISRTITSFGTDIRDAYHRALIGNPKIDGEIAVSFTVRPGGDVTDVKVDRSSLNWPPLEEEILNRVKGWKFPPFEGEPIPATVPYQFHPN